MSYAETRYPNMERLCNITLDVLVLNSFMTEAIIMKELNRLGSNPFVLNVPILDPQKSRGREIRE